MNLEIIPTGTPIDVLNGGVRNSSISLLYGPTRCGKTTLMIAMANYFIEKYNSKVVYIDTEQTLSQKSFKNPNMVNVIYASSLSEQDRAIKELVKNVEEDVKLVVVDTMTGHFHKEVLKAPAKLRAKIAADLSGRLVGQIANLRRIMNDRIIFITAHLRSPVGEHFKMHVLRKMAEAVKQGKYTPSIYDYERYLARDQVSWIGGQGLGMHVQFQFRIFVDVDGSRIIRVEKWPMVPNYCVRYLQEGEGFKVLGEKFLMGKEMMGRLLRHEVEMILLEEPIEAVREEGIEVEEAGEEEIKKEVKERKKTRKTGELKLPRTPGIDELVEKEKES
ncbi:MAG: AAA family ATPase [Nitrososphaerota archaeon]